MEKPIAGQSRVIITRGDPATGPFDEAYEIPYAPGTSILDALIWVRCHVDPTLAVRYSCHANACKECSAVIDGRPGYLCSVTIKDGGTTTVAPLTNRRWLRDLVSELD